MTMYTGTLWGSADLDYATADLGYATGQVCMVLNPCETKWSQIYFTEVKFASLK